MHNNPEERRRVTYSFVWVDNVFTSVELDGLVSFCSKEPLTPGMTSDSKGENIANSYRTSKNRFFGLNDDTRWFFERINSLIQWKNEYFWKMDLSGYDEFQYGEYHSDEEGHYDWHMDMLLDGTIQASMHSTRKLSMTLLLNEPGVDYEGGEFQFNLGNVDDPCIPAMKKGRIILFPSFLIHRVKPVTKGVRKSIVIWVTGPKFV